MITYKNDSKEKWQSHEAIFDIEYGPENNYLANAFGYGATKQEAKENLLKELKKLVEQLTKVIEENSDSPFVTAIRANSEIIAAPETYDKSKLIAAPETYDKSKFRDLDYSFHRLLTDICHQNYSVPVLKKDSIVRIAGSIVEVIENKAIAIAEELIEITVTEPNVIDYFVNARPNSCIKINGYEVIYTRKTIITFYPTASRFESWYTLTNESDLLYVAFKPDFIQICSMRDEITEVDSKTDLVIKCLALTETERKRLAEDSNESHNSVD